MTVHCIRMGVKSAVIASDSLSYAVDRRPLGITNKCLVLPQARSVLLYRGQTQCVIDAWATLTAQLDLVSIEQIGERLPDILRPIAQAYCRNAGIHDHTKVVMLEIVTIGWSQRDKCCRFVQFLNADDFAPEWFPAGSYGVTHFPNIPADALPQNSTSKSVDAQMVDTVIAMGEWLHRHHNIPTGGEVIATEVSQRGVEQRILYRYPNYEQTRVDGAAIVGRLERGDYDHDMVKRELVGLAEAERLVERRKAS